LDSSRELNLFQFDIPRGTLSCEFYTYDRPGTNRFNRRISVRVLIEDIWVKGRAFNKEIIYGDMREVKGNPRAKGPG
jgi:hypothetical protein